MMNWPKTSKKRQYRQKIDRTKPNGKLWSLSKSKQIPESFEGNFYELSSQCALMMYFCLSAASPIDSSTILR